MKIILLTQGQTASIDDADYDLVMQYAPWCAHKGRIKSGFYAAHNCGSKTVHMHCLIMGFPLSKVDHIDGDGLNNQRANLRLADNCQSAQNRGKQTNPTSSKFKGVYWSKKRQHWVATITANKSHVYIGSFQSEEEAAKMYDAAATFYCKNFAKTNFDNSSPYVPKNKRGKSSNCTGVYRRGHKWAANITVNRHRLHLGLFNTELEAIEARKKAEQLLPPL